MDDESSEASPEALAFLQNLEMYFCPLKGRIYRQYATLTMQLRVVTFAYARWGSAHFSAGDLAKALAELYGCDQAECLDSIARAMKSSWFVRHVNGGGFILHVSPEGIDYVMENTKLIEFPEVRLSHTNKLHTRYRRRPRPSGT